MTTERYNILAVDPGLKGYLCHLTVSRDGREILDAPGLYPYDPETNWFTGFVPEKRLHKNQPVELYMEKAQASTQMGVTSAFTYGKTAGMMQAALEFVLYVRVTALVPASVWKPPMGLAQEKAQSVKLANDLLHHWIENGKVKPFKNHDAAEAFLLAKYCALYYNGGQYAKQT